MIITANYTHRKCEKGNTEIKSMFEWRHHFYSFQSHNTRNETLLLEFDSYIIACVCVYFVCVCILLGREVICLLLLIHKS